MTNGLIPMRGRLTVRKNRPSLVRLLLNFLFVWRGLWRREVARLCGISTMYATLRVQVHKLDGTVVDYGIVATRCVTTAFVTDLAQNLVSAGANWLNYKHHASGTGTTAEAVGNTALVSDSGVTRVVGTQTNPGAGQYQSVATMTYASTQAITEHGLFNASTAGTLMDRSVFAAVNVASGESITFTYVLTVSAGG